MDKSFEALEYFSQLKEIKREEQSAVTVLNIIVESEKHKTMVEDIYQKTNTIPLTIVDFGD